MTTHLASILDTAVSKDPSIYELFFTPKEKEKIKDEYVLPRECPEYGFPPKCTVNLSFGFFFDGTNNNLLRDRDHHAHSNVARLYEAFPGGKDDNGSQAWPQLKDKYHNSFFRTYVPGVGTPFDEVKDSGQGFDILTDDRPRGLALCYLGENRIIWALVEAINNVHQYYTGGKLINKKEFQATFNKLTLPRYKDRHYRAPSHMDRQQGAEQPIEKFLNAFTDALRKLHDSLKTYVPVGKGKVMDRGEVKHIYASMFGFSRGAAEARAFCNWFVWLCEQDAKIAGKPGLSLGTISVTIDFLGLFDTVASVGVAALVPIADGHQAWADAESSLRIPDQLECLHLVSSHEIRRSFPLDSVSYEGKVPNKCTEIVFPGVHSDIGGGYKPLEQGRGKDEEGADMISRITLAVMYRAARLAGVPLKLEEAPESVKRAFKVDPTVIEKFNAYIKHTNEHFENRMKEDRKPQAVPLEKLMAQQHQLYILWRKKMAGKMKDLPNVAHHAVSAFDKTDIEQADKELEQEIKNFNKWMAWKKNLQSQRSSPKGPTTTSPPPFHNPEWIDVENFWEKAAPPAAITDFLEQFVHDSRAWFKPFGKDIPDLLHALDVLAAQEEKEREWDVGHGKNSYMPNPFRLSKTDRARVLKYRSVKGTPEELSAIIPDKTGREDINPLINVPGGYLRYRRIYMGSDSYKPTGAHYAGLMHRSFENTQIAENASSAQDVA